MMKFLGVVHRFAMEHVAPVIRWTIGSAVFLGGLATLGESIASHRSTERILEWSLGASLLMIVGLFVHVKELDRQLASGREEKSARSEWAIAVEQVGENPAPLDASVESVEDWLAFESEKLMRPLLEHEAHERARKARSGGLPTKFGILESTQMQNLLNGVSAFSERPENRTAEEFRKEVVAYVDGSRPNAVAAAAALLVEKNRSHLNLRLRNLTNSNLAGVKLEFEIDAPAKFLVEAPIEDNQLPARPRRWGPRTKLPFLTPNLSGINPHYFPKVVPLQPQVMQDGHSSKVVFFPVHLRPDDEVVLDPISIVVTAEWAASHVVRARWRLTSSSEDGQRDGELEVVFGQAATITSVLDATVRERMP